MKAERFNDCGVNNSDGEIDVNKRYISVNKEFGWLSRLGLAPVHPGGCLIARLRDIQKLSFCFHILRRLG